MRRIECKFNDIVIAPGNAFGFPRSEEYVTNDGVVVNIEFISSWDNSNDIYNGEIDDECRRLWSVPFSSLRSMWISRIGKCDDFWHKVKMIRK